MGVYFVYLFLQSTLNISKPDVVPLCIRVFRTSFTDGERQVLNPRVRNSQSTAFDPLGNTRPIPDTVVLI